MSMKAKFVLQPEAASYLYGKVKLTPNGTLVFDGEKVLVKYPGQEDRVFAIPADQYGAYLNHAQNAANRGHLIRLHDEERSKAELHAELIATGLKVNAAIKSILEEGGFNEIKDLEAVTREELKEQTDGLGAKRLDEIEAALKLLGKSLKVKAKPAAGNADGLKLNDEE